MHGDSDPRTCTRCNTVVAVEGRLSGLVRIGPTPTSARTEGYAALHRVYHDVADRTRGATAAGASAMVRAAIRLAARG